MEIQSNPMNTSISSRVFVEGIWPTSPPALNISSNFISDPRNNNACVTGYPHILSNPIDEGPKYDNQVDNGKKSEDSMDCWLFGVNLRESSNTTTVSTACEKETGWPTTIPSGPKEKESIPPAAAAACETGKGQNPNNNNNTVSQKEEKQIDDASPNERQSKQASVLSMRTRTKVHFPAHCNILRLIPFIFFWRITLIKLKEINVYHQL